MGILLSSESEELPSFDEHEYDRFYEMLTEYSRFKYKKDGFDLTVEQMKKILAYHLMAHTEGGEHILMTDYDAIYNWFDHDKAAFKKAQRVLNSNMDEIFAVYRHIFERDKEVITNT